MSKNGKFTPVRWLSILWEAAQIGWLKIEIESNQRECWECDGQRVMLIGVGYLWVMLIGN